VLPAELGFMMPAEWKKHRQTFMEWPVKTAQWPEPYSQILTGFTNIVKTIAEFEPVTVLTCPAQTKEAQTYLQTTPTRYSLQIVKIKHNDSWIRDNGPTFVCNRRKQIAGINWKFNAWGGKYPYAEDEQVAAKLLNLLEIPRFDAPFILEGGSFHVDGEGTLLTTEECLLSKNRNPHLEKKDIEKLLHAYLGVTKVIWLPRGLADDETDGHIDNVACFAHPGLIIMQDCTNPEDPNYEIAEENRKILESATDAQGRNFMVFRIPQPPSLKYQNLPLTLSYINFYFVNGGLVLPVFSGEYGEKADLPHSLKKEVKKTDEAAESILKKVFPDRQVVPVDGRQVARGGGNVHCLTLQMPTDE